jgi:hypothetical protein
LSIGRVFCGEPIQVELTALASAEEAAGKNWGRNLGALEILQPYLMQWVKDAPIPLEWVFGRDGYLTAKDGAGWWRGCSVPLLAGREMLKKLELGGLVGCFVCPSHAGEIRACFERLAGNQAFVAVVPDPLTLAVILHCDDFSEEIRGGRLLFAGGWDWEEKLTEIFESQPGLALPQTFIRTVLTSDEELTRFANSAQGVIADLTQRRAQRITMVRESAERSGRRSGKVLVIAPGLVRVSDLSGIALEAALCAQSGDEGAIVRLDPDCPLSGSPVAVAMGAAECDAVVTANSYRSGFPGIVATNRPWITWATLGPRAILAPDENARLDRVLLADPDWQSAARQMGWRDEQIEVVGWPDRLGLFAASEPAGKLLGLVADIQPGNMPEQLKEISSHRLLWEFIAEELAGDPLALGNDPQKYLQIRMDKLKISAEKFDFGAFFERLIFPLYWSGLAAVATKAGLQVSIIGRRCVDSTQSLVQRILECGAFINPIPGVDAHALDALGRPVVQPGGMNQNEFIHAAREALGGNMPVKGQSILPLSLGKVLSMIPNMRWPSDGDDGEKCSD